LIEQDGRSWTWVAGFIQVCAVQESRSLVHSLEPCCSPPRENKPDVDYRDDGQVVSSALFTAFACRACCSGSNLGLRHRLPLVFPPCRMRSPMQNPQNQPSGRRLADDNSARMKTTHNRTAASMFSPRVLSSERLHWSWTGTVQWLQGVCSELIE